MSDFALTRARTRRIKPPPPGWWAAMFVGIFFLGWLVYNVLNLLSGDVKLSYVFNAIIDYLYFRTSWPYMRHPDRFPGFVRWVGELPLTLMIALSSASMVSIVIGI